MDDAHYLAMLPTELPDPTKNREYQAWLGRYRERIVAIMKYRLFGERPLWTQREIADEFGISQQRVHQIEDEVIAYLRENGVTTNNFS